jgi:hypothetical protein
MACGPPKLTKVLALLHRTATVKERTSSRSTFVLNASLIFERK